MPLKPVSAARPLSHVVALAAMPLKLVSAARPLSHIVVLAAEPLKLFLAAAEHDLSGLVENSRL